MRHYLTPREGRAGLVCLIFAIIATAAAGAEIQVEAAQCHFDMSNGAFQGQGHETHNLGVPRCGLASYRDRFKATVFGMPIGWSIGLFAASPVTSNANRAVADEDVGTSRDTQANESIFNASGQLRAILPTVTLEKSWGRFSITGELGALFQETHIQGSAYNQNWDNTGDYDRRCHISLNQQPAAEIGLLLGYRITEKWKLITSARHFEYVNKGCPLSNYDGEVKMYAIGLNYAF